MQSWHVYHGSQVLSPKSEFTCSESVQSQPLRARKLGLTTSHGSQVPSPEYDMDAYMAPVFGVRFGLCVDSWDE